MKIYRKKKAYIKEKAYRKKIVYIRKQAYQRKEVNKKDNDSFLILLNFEIIFVKVN